MSVADYSTTPSSNTSISGLAVSDATAVDSVDDIIRQLMADIAEFRDTLDVGSDVQAFDQALADISGLAVTDGGFIVGDGTNFVLESGATARTSLGLGGLATLDILDEDDFATDSATRPPSQQSTAAFVNGRLVGTTLDLPSISFGTSYQNTTGRDIIFAATISATATAALLLEISTDNATWGAIASGTVTTPNQVTYGGVIPKDFYYRLRTTAGTGVVNSVRRYI